MRETKKFQELMIFGIHLPLSEIKYDESWKAMGRDVKIAKARKMGIKADTESIKVEGGYNVKYLPLSHT